MLGGLEVWSYLNADVTIQDRLTAETIDVGARR